MQLMMLEPQAISEHAEHDQPTPGETHKVIGAQGLVAKLSHELGGQPLAIQFCLAIADVA
ncbi:hypothetical protein C2W62_09325 [Candidatus Entotheonella serta]|nr:hypothetical protein C2W62_09325 [Candidatus Entotheonella serta]